MPIAFFQGSGTHDRQFLLDMAEATRRSLKESEDLHEHRLRLDAHIREAGLQPRPVTKETEDGNCLIHAVSDQLNRLGLEEKSHHELRLLAVQTLRDQPLGVSTILQTGIPMVLYYFHFPAGNGIVHLWTTPLPPPPDTHPHTPTLSQSPCPSITSR